MKFLITTTLLACASLAAVAQNYYGSSRNSSTNYGYGTYNNSLNSTYGGQTNSSVRYQNGYMRSNGTYVQGHYRTNSNNTNYDNFSTSGNVNTFTGTSGYRARDYSSGAYNYGSGRTIYQGSRGGQFYYNNNGTRTYVPKRQYGF